MGWQEKLKDYNAMQKFIKEDEEIKALKNIVREIERNKLNTMCQLLCSSVKEENQKTYIVEVMTYFEAKKYDKETGHFCLCAIPEGYFETYESKQDAEDKAKAEEKMGYKTKIYHLSILDIEDMLR